MALSVEQEREEVDTRLAKGEKYLGQHPDDENAKALYWRLWQRSMELGELEESCPVCRQFKSTARCS